jgi:hypothetical protein
MTAGKILYIFNVAHFVMSFITVWLMMRWMGLKGGRKDEVYRTRPSTVLQT